MRIAYITADPGVPVFGSKGCSIHVQEVLRAIAGRGAELQLFATSCAGEPSPGLGKVRLHPLPPAPKGDLASREQKCLLANEPLRATLEREGPFSLVYERHSLWSFAAMEYARASGERATERALSAATALVAVSAEVAEYLANVPAARGKVHVVPNGVNPERF